MTLEEKVGQLGRWVGDDMPETSGALSPPESPDSDRHEMLNAAPMQDVFVIATVTRPVKQLAGFARVALEAGETVEVSFDVHADRTAFLGREMQRFVEPGPVEVPIVASATELPCWGRVRPTGPVRTVGDDRRLVTPVDIRAGARE